MQLLPRFNIYIVPSEFAAVTRLEQKLKFLQNLQSLTEIDLHFVPNIYGAAKSKLLDPIEIFQRKSVRDVARAKYSAHTDHQFKICAILKHCDVVYLNQTVFVRNFKNKKLPCSYNNIFKNLTLEEHKSREDDYNLKQKPLNNNIFFNFPSVQLIRNWNRNSVVIKSQADISFLKNDFIINKIKNMKKNVSN